uniref:CARMIL C-terminal domain-containing protein n=1 Tax=Romanomermis culicivorax TaxID=13658 RepID=A0A915KKM7_ROMCU
MFSDFIFSLSQSLLQNVNLPLQILDLSGNTFDDHKGTVGQLASALSSLSALPSRINLDDCCLNAKSVTYLCDKVKIVGNERGRRDLLFLSLAGNSFKDDAIDMHSLLTYSPFLSYLNLSGTNFHLDKIWSPLKTCHQSLVTLLLSGCSFSSRKMSKDLNLLTSIKDFFSCAQKLTLIDLSDCILPAEVLKYILLGLVCNQSSELISLNMSRSFADRQCISHLETCAPDLTVISKMILRDCALEQEAVTLLPALASMKNLKCLDMGGNNFTTSKKQQSKYLRQILMELVKLIGEESSSVQELILSDCKIGVGLCVLINALGVAPCLKVLDISGNEITNFGARLLGKALQINSALEVLLIDRNQINHEGYADIAHALKFNNSLLSLPSPIQDVSESLKLWKEKTETVMSEIELLLRRNNKGQGFNDCIEASSWIYQTHSKLLLGNVEEELNQAVSKTNRLLLDFLVDETSDVLSAQKLMHDAEIAKDMLDKLVSLSENGENITHKMDDLADTLSSDSKALLTAKVKKDSLNSLGSDRITTPAFTPSGKKRFKFFGKRPLSIVEFRERALLEGSTENCDSNSIELVNKEDFNVSTDDSVAIIEKAAHQPLTHIQKNRARPPMNRRARAMAMAQLPSNSNSSSTVDEGVDKFFNHTITTISYADVENFNQPVTSSLSKWSDESENRRLSRLPASIPTFSPNFVSELENKVSSPLVNSNFIKQENFTNRHLTVDTEDQKMRNTPVKVVSPKVEKPSFSPIKQSIAATGEFDVNEMLSLVDKNFGDQKTWLNYDTSLRERLVTKSTNRDALCAVPSGTTP